jgi:hypothetical protein
MLRYCRDVSHVLRDLLMTQTLSPPALRLAAVVGSDLACGGLSKRTARLQHRVR